LTLHPASLEEINKVWTAATVPLRLSAIYEVSVVLMKAEAPTAQPVPVLLPQIGAGEFKPIWIEGTESKCTFTLPGENQVRMRILTNTPVAVGETFWIKSIGFSPLTGKIFLSNPAWTSNVEVTGWMTRDQRSENRIELTLSSSVDGKAIVPGLYQICLQQGNAQSNFSPLAVAPMIFSQVPPETLPSQPPGIDPDHGPPGTLFTISGGPFNGEDMSVRVYFGTRLLDDVTEFSVDSESTIEARVPTDLETSTYVVRVVVNGISTLPTRWFEVTEP
jgi:hypothetical protein